jgi:hypothetical protein
MFFDTLRALPTFITIWTRVVRYLESQATSSSKEVSHAAIGSFQGTTSTMKKPLFLTYALEIIFEHVDQPSCPSDVRDVTWVTLERVSVCLVSYPEISTKSISEFMKIIVDLFNKTRTFIVPSNLRRLIRMTHPLALYVEPDPPQTTVTAVGQPSALQASILALLQSLVSNFPFPFLLLILLSLLSPIQFSLLCFHNFFFLYHTLLGIISSTVENISYF